jgi:nucleolar protein 14
MRNKTGGIMDRRFGENDPHMTPEERAAERFARESQRKMRKDNLFNLEEDDDEEEELTLTHGGQSLSFGDSFGDDFAEHDIDDEEVSDEESRRKRKRALAADEVDDMDGMASEDDDGEDENEPLRKKSKAEVMKEVIAKSKLYKYERQKAKEDDDDLRAELDKGLPDLFDLMRGIPPPQPAPKPEAPKEDAALMNPDRAALLNGKDRAEADIEYDKRLKQMAYDKRSQPTDRTMTEEEKAQEDAERLKQLEAERLRRMRGDEESEEEAEHVEGEEEADDDSLPDDAKAFGLAAVDEVRPELDVEDEDDFIIDDDLVEMGSNADLSFDESEDEEEEEEEEDDSEDEELMDDEFTKSLKDMDVKSVSGKASGNDDNGLAYTYPCPQSHDELLAILEDKSVKDLPVIVQRIRALYHPRLHSENKARLGNFSKVLVEHVAYMANQHENAFNIIENLLRHIHSMAKTNSEPVAHAFREHVRAIAVERPLNLLPGDLVILTAVVTLFPTSDHFHAVVTPANLCIARYLGQSTVNSLSDLATGAYLAALSLEYQTLAKRYMPEFMNYCLNALCILSPTKINNLGFVFLRESNESLRLSSLTRSIVTQKLQFWDATDTPAEDLKASLASTLVSLLDVAGELWSAKTAFKEIFTPAQTILHHLKKASSSTTPKSTSSGKPTTLHAQIVSTHTKLTTLLTLSHHSRRPLLLHNHRPLAIKQSIPKFEEDFNPDKHYDPNRERAELAKLRAEHKRERKGAMRELRKDANFVAREQLRDKKERDAAYEKKYRRLVAEIQGEEGREAKAYEREKKWRQGKK